MTNGRDGVSHQWWKCIPRPEGNHETEPSKEENAPVDVDRVEEWYTPGLSVDRVDFRTPDQVRQDKWEPHITWNSTVILMSGKQSNLPVPR